MWAAIPFFTSLILLAGYVWFRMWEEKRGVKLWAGFREEADHMVLHAYRSAVMGNIPSHFRKAVIHFFHQAMHTLVVVVVETLRAIERPLSKLSYRMRRTNPAGNGKQPSQFLKTITPEKKQDDGAPPQSGV